MLSFKNSLKRNRGEPHHSTTTHGAHPLVSAFSGKLLGQPSDLFGGFSDALGTGDQVLLGATLTPHQLRQTGHQQRHFLSRSDDVVVAAAPLLHFLVQAVGSHLPGK